MKDEYVIDQADACRWLAQLFMHEVTEVQVVAYQEGAAETYLDVMGAKADIQEAREAFQHAIDGLPEVPVRSLAADFAALFLLGEMNNAQPYAGLYQDGAVLGAAHDRMLARLKAQSLAPRLNEPADHVSFQLEYLALLMETPDQASETATTFVRTEMLPWLSSWYLAAQNVPTRSGFHKAAVALTVAYLTRFAQG